MLTSGTLMNPKNIINKEYFKEYRLKNKKQIKEYRKKYYSKNKEREKKQMREWGLKNKEQRKEYNSRLENKKRRRNWTKKRYQTNVNFKLLTLCRARLLAALKGKSKSASTMELIGCTIEELRKYIESQFKPWMTWKNHGLWDVDHIKACANFDLTDSEQQRACFHWSNLQPLEHIENIKKGAR